MSAAAEEIPVSPSTGTPHVDEAAAAEILGMSSAPKAFVDLSASLTEEQRGKIAAMRAEVSSVFGELSESDQYWASDSGLLRFLVARGWSVKDGATMWKTAMEIRTKERYSEILTNGYQPPVVLRRYFPWGFIALDKSGYPVLYERIGKIDLIGLLQAVGQADFLKWVVHYHERQESLMRRVSSILGKDRNKFSVIIDMEGLNSRHFSMGTLNALKPRTVLEEKMWPETVKRLFLINTPRVSFVSSTTVEIVFFCPA
jgi:CRAL/TRIO domain